MQGIGNEDRGWVRTVGCVEVQVCKDVGGGFGGGSTEEHEGTCGEDSGIWKEEGAMWDTQEVRGRYCATAAHRGTCGGAVRSGCGGDVGLYLDAAEEESGRVDRRDGYGKGSEFDINCC